MTDYKAFSVTQVNRYIKSVLEDDALLGDLRVEGELSNFKRHTSGHLYFTLKDASSALNTVMFAQRALTLKFIPRDGARVIVFGHISLYEKTGQYQLYADYIQSAGEGLLQAAFAELRERLKAEGLFAPERKRKLPDSVRCIALVTSPIGAAVRDIIKIIKSRDPSVKIVIFPALVQGQNAAGDIARAIAEANEWKASTSEKGADIIITGRGGGSAEDLQAFNEEVVARAIAGSRIPVISAVGHETDFSIADFAADIRAATPSEAAVLAVEDAADKKRRISVLSARADKAIQTLCASARLKLRVLSGRPCLTRPMDAVVARQLHVQALQKDLNNCIERLLRTRRAELQSHTALLESFSPYALWKRGYGLVSDETGKAVCEAGNLLPGQILSLSFRDGEAEAQVRTVNLYAVKI